jgi:hypothetical protein
LIITMIEYQVDHAAADPARARDWPDDVKPEPMVAYNAEIQRRSRP